MLIEYYVKNEKLKKCVYYYYYKTLCIINNKIFEGDVLFFLKNFEK